MKIIKQIEGSDACFLACLESFLYDHGIFIGQECMIKILMNKHLCTEKGFVSDSNMVEACDILNIDISRVDYHYPIDKIYEKDGSLLIGTMRPPCHCRRFWKQDEDIKIIVMDPLEDNYQYWDKTLMESQAPQYYRIKLKTMNQYLMDLFHALKQVNSRYYFAETYKEMDERKFNEDERKPIIQSTENSFSAELFRHWRNIMEPTQNNINRHYQTPIKLALDFDLKKKHNNPKIIENGSESIRPDLVLHESQLNWHPDCQKVYVEVKTNPKTNAIKITKDIQKIISAITEIGEGGLGFEVGVFVNINTDYKALISMLKEIIESEEKRLFENQIQVDWNRIYLIHSSKAGLVTEPPISFLQISPSS